GFMGSPMLTTSVTSSGDIGQSTGGPLRLGVPAFARPLRRVTMRVRSGRSGKRAGGTGSAGRDRGTGSGFGHEYAVVGANAPVRGRAASPTGNAECRCPRGTGIFLGEGRVRRPRGRRWRRARGRAGKRRGRRGSARRCTPAPCLRRRAGSARA